MDKMQMLENRLQSQDGVISAADAAEMQISKVYFMEFVRRHHLERVAHGIYHAPDAWQDSFRLLQMRFPKIIFSHESAAYLFNLAEREPLRMTVTVPSGYHSAALSESAKVYQIRQEVFELGLTQAVSPTGFPVRVYNAERTVCDLLRSRSQVEIQDLLAALKTYVRQTDRNIPLLTRYAKKLRVENKLRSYLEVLL